VIGLRVAVSLGLIAPTVVSLGLGFPLGLRLCERAELRRVGPQGETVLGPWLWAINGASGVCSSGLALMTSMLWGVDVTLWIGAACYAVLTTLTVPLRRAAG
jgi:hypothetical protein